MRSPSPYQRSTALLGGGDSGFEGTPLPSSISPLPALIHIRPLNTFDVDISSNNDNGTFFEGQSPAPFTAPPSPAPTSKNEVQRAFQVGTVGESSAGKRDVAQTLSQPTQNNQKTRYKQTEELEVTERLNDLRSKHGLYHPATIDTAMRLAGILIMQGRYRSAELLCKQCAECLLSTLGENNPRTLDAFGRLALCFVQEGQLAKAGKLYRAVYSKASQIFRQSDREFLYLKIDFAYCVAGLGDVTAAERALRETRVIGRKVLRADDPIRNQPISLSYTPSSLFNWSGA
jgi:hypothetical protein